MRFIALSIIPWLILSPIQAVTVNGTTLKDGEEVTVDMGATVDENYVDDGFVIDEYGYKVTYDEYWRNQVEGDRMDEIYTKKIMPMFIGVLAFVPGCGFLAGTYILLQVIGG